ncbi:MAG: hypothetical protein Fur006_27550 [Coleofasciculaceae cyanobacterium]
MVHGSWFIDNSQFPIPNSYSQFPIPDFQDKIKCGVAYDTVISEPNPTASDCPKGAARSDGTVGESADGK